MGHFTFSESSATTMDLVSVRKDGMTNIMRFIEDDSDVDVEIEEMMFDRLFLTFSRFLDVGDEER